MLADGDTVLLDGCQRGVVVVRVGQLEQLVGVLQTGLDPPQGVDDIFQRFFLAAQILGMLGVVPDVGVLEFGVYDQQAFSFGLVVKDTSEAPRGDRCNPRYGC